MQKFLSLLLLFVVLAYPGVVSGVRRRAHAKSLEPNDGFTKPAIIKHVPQQARIVGYKTPGENPFLQAKSSAIASGKAFTKSANTGHGKMLKPHFEKVIQKTPEKYLPPKIYNPEIVISEEEKDMLRNEAASIAAPMMAERVGIAKRLGLLKYNVSELRQVVTETSTTDKRKRMPTLFTSTATHVIDGEAKLPPSLAAEQSMPLGERQINSTLNSGKSTLGERVFQLTSANASVPFVRIERPEYGPHSVVRPRGVRKGSKLVFEDIAPVIVNETKPTLYPVKLEDPTVVEGNGTKIESIDTSALNIAKPPLNIRRAFEAHLKGLTIVSSTKGTVEQPPATGPARVSPQVLSSNYDKLLPVDEHGNTQTVDVVSSKLRNAKKQ